ncbi:immune inhibitor A domain-containing protein [Actinacidiphila glaucinigra]|uniref:Immune inhibitor A n=1 Tax=Actinacidiphila glaucinigra TaxID=235986 RepID=A0A239J303_9ACTN|nr:immune inhibitor A domain-containing protein [Actinacidiphila glaucinigra]SNS99653.1 immune inhibitor A [Actinacidiphila glaucinigra]
MKSQRRTIRSAALAVAIAAIGATAFPVAAAQADPQAGRVVRHDPAKAERVEHDLKGPLSDRQDAQRQQAIEQVISGKSKVEERGSSDVVKLGKNKYVELAREKTDKIFVILAEFGGKTDPAYGGTPGPAHNEIAKPDPRVDNSTEWQADYNRQHFQDMYFSKAADKESMAKYYERQSSGRYSVAGEVADWVKVDWNEARYGSNKCDTCTWNLVADAVNKWVAARKAAGDSPATIKAKLAEYDQWDRYDYDGDGNFNESDGYIDHFQIVHAGEDESAGGGAQGEDAIWAHRWYAYGTDLGATGPEGNLLGGTQIGDTGVWVGDYTVQPENGGLGVFAHEFGHDLGLPDHYDTTNTAENSTGFWTLMSSGSWLGTGKDAIGDLPGDMTAWDKLQLGWLNYATAKAGKISATTLGVAEYNTAKKQGLVVTLPKKTVTTELAAPAEGTKQWWSGKGNDLSNTLTRDVDLTGKTSASLSLKAWYDIERSYDYLYTEVSTDGGSTWTPLDGTIGGAPLPRDASDKPALTGTAASYQDMVLPLDAYAGQSVKLRFRYQSDGGVALKGFLADAITVTADGATVLSDGAESGDNGWTAKGFSAKGSTFSEDYAQYYIAENRQYVSYDKTLKVGPYNFGWAAPKDNWVEHYAYQNGLLVWLWDTSQDDNNVSEHAGSGRILPIDAHPKALKWSDGTVMRNRIQAYDSTFTRARTDAVTLHKNGVATKIASQPGVSVFDDKNSYWSSANPTGSVKVSPTNTRITILHEAKDGSTVTLMVSPSKK